MTAILICRHFWSKCCRLLVEICHHFFGWNMASFFGWNMASFWVQICKQFLFQLCQLFRWNTAAALFEMWQFFFVINMVAFCSKYGSFFYINMVGFWSKYGSFFVVEKCQLFGLCYEIPNFNPNGVSFGLKIVTKTVTTFISKYKYKSK